MMSKGKLIIRPLPEPRIWRREPEPWTRREKIEILLIAVLPVCVAFAYLAAMCLWAIYEVAV